MTKKKKKPLLEELKLMPCKWKYTLSRLKGTHEEYLWKALFDTEEKSITAKLGQGPNLKRKNPTKSVRSF